MRTRRRGNFRQMSPLVFATISAIIVVALLIGGSLRLANILQPQSGDILTFLPGKAAGLDSHATITARSAMPALAAACVLDPRIMHTSGGSLVIEAVERKPQRLYHVHWAGVRTSDGGGDCGRSAELLLTPADLVVLTLAANGNG